MGLFDSGNGGNQQLAVDWEAKTIPLLTYKTVLHEQNECILSIKGMLQKPTDVAVAHYAAALYGFYQTVVTEFSEWMKEEYGKETEGELLFLKKYPQFMYDKKPLSEEDYNNLSFLGTQAPKLHVMFRVLKYWCDTHGPFRTYTIKHDPGKAFMYD